MANVVLATGPPSPMFSPAEVQFTPAAVSRLPSAASPGHWCDSPHPVSIVALCLAALVSRPPEKLSAFRPADARAWLIRSSTSVAAVPGLEPDELDGVLAGELGVWLADGEELGVGWELRWPAGVLAADDGTWATATFIGLLTAHAPVVAEPHAVAVGAGLWDAAAGLWAAGVEPRIR